MSKQREALLMALEALENRLALGAVRLEKAVAAIREALAEPELEFWPGDVLICKEDGTKVTVVHGNRGAMQLMNGKIAVAWDDNVGGEYTIKQIKEMFYQDTALPTRKPLTDEQITQICMSLWSGGWREKAMQDFARAIERAHGIGELSRGAIANSARTSSSPLSDERIEEIIASNVTITDRNLYGAVYMAIREVEQAHGITE